MLPAVSCAKRCNSVPCGGPAAPSLAGSAVDLHGPAGGPQGLADAALPSAHTGNL